MSIAEQTPDVEKMPSRSRPPKRNGRWSGYAKLLMIRMLELKREPEVVFWVFVFPLLLALGLGIAFRNTPAPSASPVAIVAGAQAQSVEAMLRRSPLFATSTISIIDADAAQNGFRLGKYELVIASAGDGGHQYRYDPARPESVLARSQVDNALQSAAGRKDA